MRNCILDVRNENPNLPILYLIHGYSSHKEEIYGAFYKFSESGFRIIACDSSGEHDENYNHFTGSLEYHSNIIKNLHKNVIIIGHSLGGVMAINLSKLDNVLKIFVIASPYDASVLSNPNLIQSLIRGLKDLIDSKRKFTKEIFEIEMEPIFPANNKFDESDTSKIYLIYSKHDSYIPLEQFNLMKKNLNISKDRCLIIKFKNHISIIYSKKVFMWIKKTIISKKQEITFKDDKTKKVILTIPHGYCIKDIAGRHCDILASEFGRILMDKLKQFNPQPNVKIIESHLLRSYIDQNRPNAKNSVFWKELKSELYHSNENSILIDIHSFPGDEFEHKFEIYQLDLASTPIDDSFNIGLSKFLRKNKVICPPPFPASDINAIINYAIYDHNISKITLIEINEKLSEKRMQQIAQLIARFIQTYS